MNYVGIDIHKRYSVLVAVDERGRELARGRINGNTAFGFAQFFAGLKGPSQVVLEACWNWGRIYEYAKIRNQNKQKRAGNGGQSLLSTLASNAER